MRSTNLALAKGSLYEQRGPHELSPYLYSPSGISEQTPRFFSPTNDISKYGLQRWPTRLGGYEEELSDP